METNPEGTAQTYIFLVDNQDIALNIVMSGYQALCLVQEDDGYYFSADSFIEEMRAIQFTGSCQCAYHYVASCTVKWVNDKLLTFFKDAGLDGKAGWQLFKEKEYLGKLDNQKEVEKLLEQYILRFERDPKEEPELSRFHLFDAKGNVKGVRDMEIVDYLVENVQFFVVGITPCYIANPCFEFWLLMHLADINAEFGEQLEKIKENPKISEHHTFVSKAVSEKGHHGKSGIKFATQYMPKINQAINQAKKFAVDEEDLIDNIGCNLWKLMEELKQYGKDEAGRL